MQHFAWQHPRDAPDQEQARLALRLDPCPRFGEDERDSRFRLLGSGRQGNNFVRQGEEPSFFLTSCPTRPKEALGGSRHRQPRQA